VPAGKPTYSSSKYPVSLRGTDGDFTWAMPRSTYDEYGDEAG